MSNYAMVEKETNVVINVILMDTADDYIVPEGKILVQSDTAAIGDRYDATLGDFERPVETLTLESLKEIKAEEISASCRAEIYAGFDSDALGGTHGYPSTDHDQINLAYAVLASHSATVTPEWTTPLWCSDATGNWAMIPHTADQVQQVGRDGLASLIALQTKNASLQAQVSEAADQAQLSLIGW